MLKFWAYNAILKFPDNGPIMLRNAPIMLKVLALFLSNLCTLIQKKKKKGKHVHQSSIILLEHYRGPLCSPSIQRACLSVKLFVSLYSMMSFTQGQRFILVEVNGRACVSPL